MKVALQAEVAPNITLHLYACVLRMRWKLKRHFSKELKQPLTVTTMMHRSLLRSGSVLTTRVAPRPSSGVRHFRKNAPIKYTENKEVTGLAGIVEADNHVLSTKLMHLTNVSLMIAVPLAFVLSPSPLVLPVDLAVGVILPVHAHIGMNNVISDYVPKNVRTLARLGWLGATSLMFLGLLRVNLEGPGITEVVKTIWRESPNKEKSEA